MRKPIKEGNEPEVPYSLSLSHHTHTHTLKEREREREQRETHREFASFVQYWLMAVVRAQKEKKLCDLEHEILGSAETLREDCGHCITTTSLCPLGSFGHGHYAKAYGDHTISL